MAGAAQAPIRGWRDRLSRRVRLHLHRLPVSTGQVAAPQGMRQGPTFFRFFTMDAQNPTMTLHLSIGPLIALVAGILILVMPRLLSTIVALYLIIIGIVGLLGMHTLRF